jgi:hypothetical protein
VTTISPCRRSPTATIGDAGPMLAIDPDRIAAGRIVAVGSGAPVSNGAKDETGIGVRKSGVIL